MHVNLFYEWLVVLESGLGRGDTGMRESIPPKNGIFVTCLLVLYYDA